MFTYPLAMPLILQKQPVTWSWMRYKNFTSFTRLCSWYMLIQNKIHILVSRAIFSELKELRNNTFVLFNVWLENRILFEKPLCTWSIKTSRNYTDSEHRLHCLVQTFKRGGRTSWLKNTDSRTNWPGFKSWSFRIASLTQFPHNVSNQTCPCGC